MTKQILTIAQSNYNVMIEWFVLFGRLIFGVGASCSVFDKCFEDIEDKNEEDDMLMSMLTILWLFNLVIIIKETADMRAYSFGFGLKPLTPMLIIGWLK